MVSCCLSIIFGWLLRCMWLHAEVPGGLLTIFRVKKSAFCRPICMVGDELELVNQTGGHDVIC